MNTSHYRIGACSLALVTTLLASAPGAVADVVTDANTRAVDIASRAMPTYMAVRAMAIVQVSVFEAVNAITARFPQGRTKIDASPGASIEAAVAAATRTALLKLVPSEQAAIDADYQAVMGSLPDGPARTDGVATGERAAATILALCADDGATTPETYRPFATPGTYVPTTLPIASSWGLRRPWVMSSGDEFRPAPPPSLTSDTWARDYNEIKVLGAKDSTRRTTEQTAIARFWETTSPSVYWPVARSVATAPGREVTRNARLLAVAGMAMDDALIAVFDAKYAYNLWRPITAIRNGDIDGNAATAPVPGWTPLINTPVHPEYPCAHCIVSGALGAVLEAESGAGSMPTLSSASPSAAGAVRTWASVGDFVQEVAMARIYDGVHYRNSTEVGTAMGKQIGSLAAKSYLETYH